MGKIDAAWHAAHRMPRHPTGAQRAAWHVEHAKHCACREMPVGVRALVARSKPAEKRRT